MLDAVCTHVTSSAASRDSAVKLMTDSYQFWVAHQNLRLTFQSHIRFARKVQKYGDAFSKSSSIYVLLIISPRWGVRFTYNHSSRLASHLFVLRCNDWALIHAGRGLRGTTNMCPQVQINGSPTFNLQRRRGHKRRFCKKQSIFRISESFFCVNIGVVRSKFTKIEIISVVLLF